MAKAKMDAIVVAVPASFVAAHGRGFFPTGELKFGKGEKIQKFAFPSPAAPTGILFVARNGEWYVADYSLYPESIQRVLMMHGAKQKLGDEYASLDEIEDCMEAVRALDEQLATGNWRAERQTEPGVSMLMRALMESFQIDEAQAREFLKPLSKKEKDALRASPELKPIIDRIESERGKGVDTQAILGKLRAQQPIG